MSTRLDAGVELLERSLGYTRLALAEVRPSSMTRPTPCDRWDLGSLLAHMDDALDAFLEAADGAVAVTRAAPATGPAVVGRLQDKACTLLGLWSSAGPSSVDVGGATVSRGLVATAAALEIAVHGWDVARSLGLAHPIPPDLARALLPVARDMAPLGRFARAGPVAPDAPAEVRLLAAVGRDARH